MKTLGKTIQYMIISLGGLYVIVAFILWKVDLLSYMSKWDPWCRGFFGLVVVVDMILSYVAVREDWFE